MTARDALEVGNLGRDRDLTKQRTQFRVEVCKGSLNYQKSISITLALKKCEFQMTCI